MMENQELCYPELFNASCIKPTLHWTDAVFLNMVLAFISLITTVLNLLIIIAVSHFRKLHTPTNILLLSLAVSDFPVGLVVMTVQIYIRTQCWYLGDLLCSLYNYVLVIIQWSSVGIMVFISVDRYVAICDPLHYSTRVTERRTKLSVCVCWFCSFSFTTLILKDDLIYAGQYKFCHGECLVYPDFIAFNFYLVLTFVAPISLIVVLYMRVFVVAVSQARAMRSHVTAVSVTVTAKKSELKAARTLGVLVVVFLLCYTPYYIIMFDRSIAISPSFITFFYFMVYFNSCMNPLIYALFYPWFRKAVKLIVTLQILQPGSCDANIL